MSSGTDRLVKSIRAHASRSIDYHVEAARYAVVTSASPLAADLGGTALNEDDLTLGYAARRLDADLGIAVGDTLVVQVVDDEFLVLEVLTDREIEAAGGGGGEGYVVGGGWRWSDSTGAPANGYIGIDAADWASATEVNVAKINANNSDIAYLLARIEPDDYIYLQQSDDSLRWGRYEVVGGPADHGTWFSIRVVFIEASGALPDRNQTTVFAVRSTPTTPEPGPTTGDKYFSHTQTGLAATWTIVHNLDKCPAIEVVDSGGNYLLADVEYYDLNTVELSFAHPTSGKAFLN